MLLWFYYTCSSKLQHIFFPISVWSFLCATLLYVPCLLILWARLPFSTTALKKEVILFENPFPLLTLLPQDVNNCKEKCTRDVLCVSTTDIFECYWPSFMVKKQVRYFCFCLKFFCSLSFTLSLSPPLKNPKITLKAYSQLYAQTYLQTIHKYQANCA